MLTIRSLEQPLPPDGPVALTLGAFDGIHVGHQRILAAVADCARKMGGRAALLTFDPHPSEVLAPADAPFLLTTLEEKLDALKSAGLDIVAAVPFTRELADTPAEAFVREILVGRLHAACIIAGYDLAFGRAREGNRAFLHRMEREAGLTVVDVDPVERDGEIVSSTAIRGCLREGDVARAARLLGRPYRVSGLVAHDQGLGKRIGVPTANLSVGPRKLIPADGIYAVFASTGGDPLPAVVNIGDRPTVPGAGRAIEAHILRPCGDIYGETLALDFVGRIRDEMKFDSLDALTEQIRKDVAIAETMLNG